MAEMLNKEIKKKFIGKKLQLRLIALIVIYTQIRIATKNEISKIMSKDDISYEIRLAFKNQAPHANPHDFK